MKHVLYFDIIYKEETALVGMEMKQAMLPVQCVKCGSMFDLGYDLVIGDGGVMDLDVVREKYGDEEHFCWACRKGSEESMRGVGVIEGDGEGEDLVLSWE